MKRLILCSVLTIGFLMNWATASWSASMNINIEIQNGSGGGFGYSTVHGCSNPSCMSGPSLYRPLLGYLNGDLEQNGQLTLSNIMGTLSSNQGFIQFSNGWLTADSGGGVTKGQLPYTFLSGTLSGQSGTFYFEGDAICCSGAPYGGPNHLTSNGFALWGKNWTNLNLRNQNQQNQEFIPLGIDLVGGNYQTTATPEPTSMLLLGSGLAGLLYWRKKQVKS